MRTTKSTLLLAPRGRFAEGSGSDSVARFLETFPRARLFVGQALDFFVSTLLLVPLRAVRCARDGELRLGFFDRPKLGLDRRLDGRLCGPPPARARSDSTGGGRGRGVGGGNPTG